MATSDDPERRQRFVTGLSDVLRPKTNVSIGESAGRGALQGASLGFADEGGALADTVISKIPGVRYVAQKLNESAGGSGGGLPLDNPEVSYQQRRDAYRATNDAARAAHPTAYTGGELAGSAATALVPGAKALQGGTLAMRAAAGAAEGAALGGTNALGSSTADLTEGNFAGAAKDTAEGMAGGAVVGAAAPVAAAGLQKIGAKARDKLADSLLKNFGGSKDVATATPTFVKQLRPAVETLKEEVMTPEGMKIAEVARKHPQAALDELNAHVSEITKNRGAYYGAVDSAVGPVSVDDYTKFLDKQIQARTGVNTPKAKDQIRILKEMIGDAEDSWGTGQSVPSLALREHVTGLQNSAGKVIGQINESERSELMHWRSDVAKDYLNTHLKEAARIDPRLAPVVDEINEMNRRAAAWLAPKSSLEDRAGKLATKALIRPAIGAGVGGTVGAVEGFHEGGVEGALAGAAGGSLAGLAIHHVAIPAIASAGRGILRGAAGVDAAGVIPSVAAGTGAVIDRVAAPIPAQVSPPAPAAPRSFPADSGARVAMAQEAVRTLQSPAASPDERRAAQSYLVSLGAR